MTTATTVLIRLPVCPDAVLSPNARAHWRRKAVAVKQLRQLAYYVAMNAKWSQDWTTATGPVTARATIGWAKGRKRMDNDNAAAMLKSAIDGLTDAGIWLDDKQVTFLPVMQERDPAGLGYIVVEIAV